MVDSTNLPEIDINAIATDLNNKMDRDGANATYPVVISRTTNSNNGVTEIWSDGYCVQTGYSNTEAGGGALTTFTFDITYNEKPNVFVNSQYSGTATPLYAFLNAINISNSSFQVRVDKEGMNFRAEGYIR